MKKMPSNTLFRKLFSQYWMVFWGLWWLQGCASVKLPEIHAKPEDWIKEDGPEGGYYLSHTFTAPFEVAWQYNLASGMGPSALAGVRGVLLAATLKGEVHAIGTDRGRKIGYVPLGEGIRGLPILWGDVLMVASTNGRYAIAAYQYTRSDIKWRRKGLKGESGLVKMGKYVGFVDAKGTVYAIDPADGREVWKTTWLDQAAAVYGTPVFVNDMLLLASAKGAVVALHAETGKVAWLKQVHQPVYNALSARLGEVWVPTTRGQLFRLSIENGRELGVFDLKNEAVRIATPAIGLDGVVFGASDGFIRKLRAQDGRLDWSFHAKGACTAPVLWAGSEIFAGCQDKTLYRISADNGALIGQLVLKGRIKSVPLLYEDRLYLAQEPNQLVAIGNPLKKSRSANPEN